MTLLSASTGSTTTFTISSNICGGISYFQCQLPCPGFTYTVGLPIPHRNRQFQSLYGNVGSSQRNLAGDRRE